MTQINNHWPLFVEWQYPCQPRRDWSHRRRASSGQPGCANCGIILISGCQEDEAYPQTPHVWSRTCKGTLHHLTRVWVSYKLWILSIWFWKELSHDLPLVPWTRGCQPWSTSPCPSHQVLAQVRSQSAWGATHNQNHYMDNISKQLYFNKLKFLKAYLWWLRSLPNFKT